MPDLTPGYRSALRFWPSVKAAARQHMTTGQVWDMVRRAAAAAGATTSPMNGADLSRLRGAAGAALRAEQAFGRALPHQAITSEMIAQAPWAPITAASAAAPNHHVDYWVRVLTDTGEEVLKEYASVFGGPVPIPATVGELTDLLAEDAQGNLDIGSGPAGGAVAGVVSVMILAE